MTIEKRSLASCPFCNSFDVRAEAYKVICGHCGASGPNGEDYRQSRTLWNMRNFVSNDAPEVFSVEKCEVEFHRKDLNVNSICGRKKNHSGEHSWFNDDK